MEKYSNLKIAEMVHAYIERAKRDNDLEAHSFNVIGTFQIIGGSQDERDTRKSVVPLYHGRFLDVVAFAVQHKDFQANWCSAEDTGNVNSGYVVKWNQPEIHAPPARPKGLDKLIKEVASKEEAERKKRK